MTLSQQDMRYWLSAHDVLIVFIFTIIARLHLFMFQEILDSNTRCSSSIQLWQLKLLVTCYQQIKIDVQLISQECLVLLQSNLHTALDAWIIGQLLVLVTVAVVCIITPFILLIIIIMKILYCATKCRCKLSSAVCTLLGNRETRNETNVSSTYS